MEEVDDIIREFLAESAEGLDQLDRDLVRLEQTPADKELLGSVFRAIHTIKGTGGVLGFPRLETLAHAGENLLSRMRDGKLMLTAEIASALLALMDALRAMLRSIGDCGNEGANEYGDLISHLEWLLETAESEHVKQSTLPRRLGEMLIAKEAATPEAVDAALQAKAAGDPRKVGQILVSEGVTDAKTVVETLREQAECREDASSTGNLRVDVTLLDRVMNLVGELVLARNRILQYTGTQTDRGLLSTVQLLNFVTVELQEGVMKMRMQPIGNVWNKLPRLVRDVAVACGKRVRLDVEGSETELDKTIIEAIKAPLTHIVRNSIDHGIEMPEARAAAGKTEEGTISLRAFHEGGYVNIEIRDDGAGIDLTRVKAKALARGSVTPEQLARMTDREVLNLVFLPGLSTAEKVTNVSGRGVGMDVVKTNIEKIGGTLDLQTVGGEGTTLKIKIPLTLAIVPALMVSCAGERYAIPQVNLLELVRLNGDEGQEIELVHDVPVYRLRGNLLPIVYLDREFGHAEEQSSRATHIVVLQADGSAFGLVVDAICDTEEIVVKPLGDHLKSIPCFAGATIMGDGHVALILDVPGLARKASVMRDGTGAEQAAAASSVSKQGEQWLLFQAGSRARMAIPLSFVSRLEEFPADAIERSGDRPVVQYRGEILPLVPVAEALGGVEQREGGPAQVIVAHTGDSRAGLIVTRILDIVDDHVEVEASGSDRGLLGSAILQGRVTDLLDTHALLETAGARCGSEGARA